MTRSMGLSAVAAAVAAALTGAGLAGLGPPAQAQAPLLPPQVQNGPVEHRRVTAIARDLAALGAGDEPVWVGWTVPIAGGPRDLCNWYSSPSLAVRGFYAEAGQDRDSSTPQIPPATGPVPLEAGSGLVVLARLVDGRLDRVRTLSDDCPIDAGGRAVYWLDGVTPATSLAWLDGLTAAASDPSAPRTTLDERRSIANAAVTAIAQHAAADADAMLERLARGDGQSSVRRQAATRLAAYRGAAGFDAIRRLIGDETDPAVRRSFISALGQTRQPGTAGALLALARTDADERARAEAVSAYARAAGTAGIDDLLDILAGDPALSVKRRAVTSLASMPGDAGVPHLIALARSRADLALKKDAVTALTRSDDPRARAFLEEIIKR